MRTNIYVVPSLKAKEKLHDEGRAWAEEMGFSFVPRRKRTISDLMKDYGENFLVYSSRGPQIDRPEGSHFSASIWLNFGFSTSARDSRIIC